MLCDKYVKINAKVEVLNKDNNTGRLRDST